MGSKDSRLSLGQRLSIPGDSKLVSRRGEAAPASKAAASAAPPRSRYVVRPGDSLFAIARANKVALKDLCSANNLNPGATLKVGQSLRIPDNGERRPAAASAARSPSGAKAGKPSSGLLVVVARGDTLYSLSLKHHTSVEAIRAANGLGQSNALKPGQKLKIP
jgi:LysM repeat protein